jgi:hypothetical protein
MVSLPLFSVASKFAVDATVTYVNDPHDSCRSVRRILECVDVYLLIIPVLPPVWVASLEHSLCGLRLGSPD